MKKIKERMKKIFVISLAFILCLAFTACDANNFAIDSNASNTNKNEKKIASTYEGKDITYIFAKDGSMRKIDRQEIYVGHFTADEETIEMMLGIEATRYNYSLF